MKLDKIAAAVNALTDTAHSPSLSNRPEMTRELLKLAQSAADELEPLMKGEYTPHFNGLSPTELEGLAIVNAQCGNVVNAVAKVMQHGLESNYHGQMPNTNRVELVNAVADFEVAVMMLVKLGMLDKNRLDVAAARQIEFYRINKRLLHHIKPL